jgi:hypothetical protein
MQTFITFRTFAKTAASLDMMRLGKQRVEALQILKALRSEGPTVGNPHAYEMWRGYEECLVYYGLIVTHEWRIVRGFKDDTWGQFAEYAADYGMLRTPDMVKEQSPVEVVYPPWMGEDWILRSHRSRLIEKMAHHYGEQFGATPENMQYLWPKWDKEHRHGYRLFLSRADLDRVLKLERELPRPLELNTETGEVVVTQ